MIIECATCAAFVEAEIFGAFEYLRREEKPSGRYVLLRCGKCGNAIFIKQNNIGNMCEGDIWDSPILLYPCRDFQTNPDAPKLIRNSYEEAGRCFRANAYPATAIICRKILEGICEEHKMSGRNLANSLEKMKNNNIIDERLFEWADALRLAGNEAAHDVKVMISYEDAKDILDFTTAIIDYIYSFRNKFMNFKMRRQVSN